MARPDSSPAPSPARSVIRLLGAATAAFAALAVWVYLDNRDLRAQLAAVRAEAAARGAAAGDAAEAREPGPRRDRGERGLSGLAQALSSAARERPAREQRRERSEGEPRESRMERRSRRSAEVASLLGRQEGESEEQYRERVMPMVTGVLERPRERLAEMRKEAEAKAGITAEQSAKIDEALSATYGELIEYTDAAISEGQLSPYQRNVSGWLNYAGGLGGILMGTEGKIGTILKPEQVQAMYDSGFEWGEYLSVSAPWEKLKAPPPPKPGQ